MAPEPVAFESGRGLKLIGDRYPGGPSAIVLCHGFTGDRHEEGRLDETARALNEDGFTVLTFDFGGSGESDDAPITIEGETEDLLAALAFTREQDAERVGILGLSYGAWVACRAAAVTPIDAFVFWAPFVTAVADPTVWYSNEQLDELDRTGLMTWGKDAGPRRHVVIAGRHLEEVRRLDQRALLGAITHPVLVLHGNKDDIVPLAASRKAMRLLPKGSKLRVVRGADHVFHAQLPTFIEHTRRWFRAWQDAAGR